MTTREYEVTQTDRHGNATTATVMLSDEDAAALGDAARPLDGGAAPTKARKSANKAQAPTAK